MSNCLPIIQVKLKEDQNGSEKQNRSNKRTEGIVS